MSDQMLEGVLRMPIEMAMGTDLSRVQFYNRAQQAMDEIERLTDELDAGRYDSMFKDKEIERLRAALAKSCEEGRDEMYDCGYNRLRAALERIDEYYKAGGTQVITCARIAREAIRHEQKS